MDAVYIVSKAFTFFLAPAVWILLLLIWRHFAKLHKVKRRVSFAAIIIFLLFSNEALYKLSVNVWQPSPVMLTQHYEAGIVLGGFVGFDASGKGYLKDAADRFYEACKLYKAGTISNIIVSGGTVASGVPEEADFIKSEMIAIGIKSQDIITETQSKTTYENAKFSKLIIDSLRLKPPYVLITSALHIPRASRVFTKAGLQIIPFPCAYDVIKNEKLTAKDWLVPNIEVLDNWQKVIKEVAGVFIYHMFNRA